VPKENRENSKKRGEEFEVLSKMATEVMDVIDVTETLRLETNTQNTTEVDKEDNLKYDLGNILAIDPKPLDPKSMRENLDQYLLTTSRDDIQLLYNKLFSLPTNKPPGGDMGVLADLPKGTTVIPREKPVPKPKPETKWEKYAKLKGIQKKKKDRMIYDENGELRPRWGYNRVNDPKDEWVVEAKAGEDPSVDPFTRKDTEKKERKSKQSKREAANKRDAMKNSSERNLPSTIATTNDYKSSIPTKRQDLKKTLKIAQKSTISMGKFDRLVEGEKRVKEKKKFDPLISSVEKTKKYQSVG